MLGSSSYVRLHNVADQSLPQLIAIPHNIAQGLFGRWAPQWAAGADRAALPFSADLSVLPFLVLPGWLAYAAVNFAQRFVAAFFTFRLLRDRFTVPGWIAIYAAFSYSLFYQPGLNHDWTGYALYDYLALPAIPFLLWLLSGIKVPWRGQSFAVAAIAGACAAFSGSIHISLFIAPLILYWFAFVTPRKETGFWLNILLFAAVWCGLTIWLDGHQWLLAKDSTRVLYKLESIWAPLSSGIWGLLAFSREFVGALLDDWVPVTLLLIGLVLSRLRNRQLIAIASAIIFCDFVGIAYGSIAIRLRPEFPFLGAFNCQRFGLLVPFLTIFAGALALNEITQYWDVSLKSETRSYSFSLGTALAALLICGLIGQSLEVKQLTLKDMLGGHNYKAYYQDAQLQQLHKITLGKNLFRVVTLSVGDTVQPDFPSGALWAYGFETADGMLNLQPQRYRDFWEQVIMPVMASEPFLYQWVHNWGCQLNLFAPIGGFPGSAPPDLNRYYRINLLSLAGVRYLVSPIPIRGEQFTPVNLQMHAEQLTWDHLNRAQKMWTMLTGHYWGPPLYVYENRDALPRFFLAKQAHVLDGENQVLNAIAVSSPTELGSNVWIESGDAQGITTAELQSGAGFLALEKYSADEIDLDANVTSPAMMVITNNYNPYWKAWIDAQPAKIIPADHTFQGLRLEAGRHRVVLKYAAPLL